MIETVLNDIIKRLEDVVRVKPFTENMANYQPDAYTEVLVRYISSTFGGRNTDRSVVTAEMEFEVTVVGHQLTGENGVYQTLDIVRERLDKYPYTIISDAYSNEYNGVWAYTQTVFTNNTTITDDGA